MEYPTDSNSYFYSQGKYQDETLRISVHFVSCHVGSNCSLGGEACRDWSGGGGTTSATNRTGFVALNT